MLCVLREKMFLLPCAFLLNSSGHTFFSEETPSLKMEPKRLSQFPLLSGEEFARGQRAREGGRQWKRTAGEDDSALFYMDVFHLFSSSPLSASLII